MHFFRDEKIYLECSLCWECKTIFIVSNGTFDFFHFNASSHEAQQLLTRLKTYIGCDSHVG